MKPSERIRELSRNRVGCGMSNTDAIIAYLDEREEQLHPIARHDMGCAPYGSTVRLSPAPASPPSEEPELSPDPGAKEILARSSAFLSGELERERNILRARVRDLESGNASLNAQLDMWQGTASKLDARIHQLEVERDELKRKLEEATASLSSVKADPMWERINSLGARVLAHESQRDAVVCRAQEIQKRVESGIGFESLGKLFLEQLSPALSALDQQPEPACSGCDQPVGYCAESCPVRPREPEPASEPRAIVVGSTWREQYHCTSPIVEVDSVHSDGAGVSLRNKMTGWLFAMTISAFRNCYEWLSDPPSGESAEPKW